MILQLTLNYIANLTQTIQPLKNITLIKAYNSKPYRSRVCWELHMKCIMNFAAVIKIKLPITDFLAS